MPQFEINFKRYGEAALLIEWPARIEEAILQDILALNAEVKKDPSVLGTIIAYHSLCVRYKRGADLNVAKQTLQELYQELDPHATLKGKLWHIPVCYDSEFGLDLEALAQSKGLATAELIHLHTEAQYLVYFIGFLPGFMYLGGLNEKIHQPRKANPRLRIPKGSVAIGGEQTGIYPQASPGGWHIIGRSPLNFFAPEQKEACFARPSDKLQFEAVDRKTYNRIAEAVQEGNYLIKSEPL